MLIPKADRKLIHEYLFRGKFLFSLSGPVFIPPHQRRPLSTLDHDKDTNAFHPEGVLVAKKDFNQPKHNEIDTKNLYVIKACQSLTSRGFLKTQFSWQWYYYTYVFASLPAFINTNTLINSLTAEGLDYLREWLHLPAEIVPQTHIKQQRSHAPPRGMLGGEGDRPRGGRGGPRGDREPREYRRREAGENKEGGAPGEFAPQFRGGFGRGRGAPAAPSS
jgi:small subunit ribosomal protein S10e